MNPTVNIKKLALNLEKEGVARTFARVFFSILTKHQEIGRQIKQAPKIVEAEVIEQPCNDGKK